MGANTISGERLRILTLHLNLNDEKATAVHAGDNEEMR